jgi:mono/diheme cytochrome c family protein
MRTQLRRFRVDRLRESALRVPRTLIVTLTVGALLALTMGVGAQKAAWPEIRDPNVTPVTGPSWLTHLGLTLASTSLGQGAGRYGPAADQGGGARRESLGVPGTVQITGADLYRLNCQACHREQGTGAPPEIHSVLGPVQGASLELVRRKLREQEGRVNERAARAETRRARASVLARMHQGGRRMPPRDHLQTEDMRMLFAYLTQLAGTPDAVRQSTRTISWARVGELTVKGTCHICHDAVGPAPSGSALLRGAVPSLESIMRMKPIGEFVHKVRHGEVVSPDDPVLRHRGRMPVFYYIRDEETAASYVYLTTYPPRAR